MSAIQSISTGALVDEKRTRWCICTFIKMVEYWIWHRLLSRMQSASKKGRNNMSKDKKNKKEKDKKKIQLFKNKNLPQVCADHWNGSKLTRSKLMLPPRGIKQKQTEFMVEKNIVQICKCRSLSSPIWTCATKTENQCRLERNTSTTTGITECQGVIAPQWNKTPEIEQDVLTGSQKVIALWSRHNYCTTYNFLTSVYLQISIADFYSRLNWFLASGWVFQKHGYVGIYLV